MITTTPQIETTRTSVHEEFRRGVIEATTTTTMRDVSEGLGRSFNKIRHVSNKSEKQFRVQQLCEQLESEWRKGKVSVLRNMDFEWLFREAYNGGENDWRGLSKIAVGANDQLRQSSVQEHLLDVMTSDQFAQLLTTTIRLATVESVMLAPTPLLDLVNRGIRLTSGTTKIAKRRQIGDVVDDCVAELEPTSFYAVPTPNLITVPPPCKKKFAVGYTREMLGVDPNGAIRDAVQRAGESMNIHIEKLLVDMMFGLYDTTTPGANPFPYIEDGLRWDTYQLVGGGGPWENDVTGNDPDGTFVPFQTIEQQLELMTDPYTGEPVVWTGTPTIVTADATAAQLLQDGLGVLTIEQDVAGAGNPRLTVVRQPGRFGDLQFRTSRYILSRLSAWYQTAAGGGLLPAAALTAARGTWLYGDLQRAFGFGTEWDREELTRSGTGTWEYFNQEVIFSVKWMEKSTPMVLDPMSVVRNRP